MRAAVPFSNGRLVVAVIALVVAAVAVVGAVATSSERTVDAPFVAIDEHTEPTDSGIASPPTIASTTPADADEARDTDAGGDRTEGENTIAESADPDPCVGDRVDEAPSTAADVVISEIHYHPAGGDEFVELWNVGADELDLTGWRIGGADACLGSGTTIGAGGRLVVGREEMSGRLSNGGEEISLITPTGAVVDSVHYGDADQWPAMADGHGDSLHRIDPATDGTNPGNWSSAAPTPGGPKPHRSWVMPVWSEVSHTVLPSPGAPIEVSGRVGGVAEVRADLAYRVGFGAETIVPLEIRGDGTFDVTIPGQAAGELVRYRLIAQSALGAIGTWPRQGDGSTYTGTTVDDPERPVVDVATIEWFIDDPVYLEAYNDILPGNDTTFPTVIAVDGEIFDGAGIGTKGRTSLGFPKPKWKVELPAGHRLEIPGVVDHPVDEFALHAAWNDKSAMREVLAHEAMADAGLPVADAFHVQLRRNGAFDGLYTYVEQSDGQWRDRVGLEDAIVYEVGAERGAVLSADDARLDDDAFSLKYQREEGSSDDELRGFLVELAAVSADGYGDAERRDWIFAHVDVASVVNTLAASAIIQHRDFSVKNYRLAFADDRWSMIPNDLELTWGRTYQPSCQSICDVVEISDPFIVANTTLTQPFTQDPVLAEMLRTRISTLARTLVDPDRIAERVEDLLVAIEPLAAPDRELWGTHGVDQSIDDAATELVDAFVVPQFERLSGATAPFGLDRIEVGDSDDVEVEVGGDVVTITNVGDRPVDLGTSPADGVAPLPGVVLTAGLGVELRDGRVVAWFDSA